MYTDFFGLQKLPFNLTPDPAFLFLPSKHREALAGLTYAVLETKGFVVLTGDDGTGKTTLINSLFNRLPADRVESSVMLNPTLTASEFLESVLLDFGYTGHTAEQGAAPLETAGIPGADSSTEQVGRVGDRRSSQTQP